MRRRLPGLSVGLAAMLRSLPTASCEVYQASSIGMDIHIPCHAVWDGKEIVELLKLMSGQARFPRFQAD
jgi:hypothetical protein